MAKANVALDFSIFNNKTEKKNFIKNKIIKQLELSRILCAVCPNNVI